VCVCARARVCVRVTCTLLVSFPFRFVITLFMLFPPNLYNCDCCLKYFGRSLLCFLSFHQLDIVQLSLCRTDWVLLDGIKCVQLIQLLDGIKCVQLIQLLDCIKCVEIIQLLWGLKGVLCVCLSLLYVFVAIPHSNTLQCIEHVLCISHRFAKYNQKGLAKY
jgi:hypothetical protein